MTTVWLCTDCTLAAAGYSEHEFGHKPQSTPLGRLGEDPMLLSPNYCSDHYWPDADTPCVNCEGTYGPDDDDGYMAFQPGGQCDGCNNNLAGEFYRHEMS